LPAVRSLDDYLFRMAKNRLFDESRAATRKRDWLRTLSEDTITVNGSEDALMLKEYYGLVDKAISLMPERRQQIFRMNAIEELTAREIADKLNLSLPVGDIEQHAARKTGCVSCLMEQLAWRAE
jgi:RNA polymerase sigma factor (sigma-70 family)